MFAVLENLRKADMFKRKILPELKECIRRVGRLLMSRVLSLELKEV